MKRNRLHTLCLLTLLPLAVDAQEMYIHGQEWCHAMDLHNMNECFVPSDSTFQIMDLAYNINDIDSITFIMPQDKRIMRCGWWGDMNDGRFCCYYRSNSENVPDMAFLAKAGICQSAAYLLPLTSGMFNGQCSMVNSPYPPSADQPRRVGRKWRYVKNTLSGHRQFQLHIFDDLPYGGYALCTDESVLDNSATEAIDLAPLLGQLCVDDVRDAVSFWYRPEQTVQLPSEPLFGSMTNNSRYEVALTRDADPVYCKVGLNLFREDTATVVISDTISIVFRSDEEAAHEFELMDTHNDEMVTFELQGRNIVILERADFIPYEDMMRRLVRFDLDICRPVFIREEE